MSFCMGWSLVRPAILASLQTDCWTHLGLREEAFLRALNGRGSNRVAKVRLHLVCLELVPIWILQEREGTFASRALAFISSRVGVG